MSTLSLVHELRSRINDSRTVVRAFGIALRDPAASSAILDVSGGYFRVTVMGGTANSLNINLNLPGFDTLGKLVRALAGLPDYVVSPDTDMDREYDTISLEDCGPIDIRQRQVDIQHKLFSDRILGDVLRRAVLRHNPSMPNPDALPAGEEELVLTLAHSMLLRQMATNSARRRGLSATTAELMAISDALEKSYNKDHTRLSRAIQSPREAASNIMREGDIVVGKFSRRLRNGRTTSYANIPPEAPVLLDPTEMDVEDTRIYLGWQRSADENFARYEVWRGIDMDITKDREGYYLSPFVPAGNPNSRDSLGAVGGWVSGLEPETQYFFRLYVVDRNGEYTGSQVLQLMTLPLRSKISQLTPPTPQMVVAGDVVTVTFDPAWAAPTADLQVLVGDKPATFTVTGPYEIRLIVPTFFQKGPKVLRILTPTGLVTCFTSLVVS